MEKRQFRRKNTVHNVFFITGYQYDYKKYYITSI